MKVKIAYDCLWGEVFAQKSILGPVVGWALILLIFAKVLSTAGYWVVGWALILLIFRKSPFHCRLLGGRMGPDFADFSPKSQFGILGGRMGPDFAFSIKEIKSTFTFNFYKVWTSVKNHHRLHTPTIGCLLTSRMTFDNKK